MSQIRQSAADWCYFRGPLDAPTVYRRLRAAGYDAVELVPEPRWPAARAAGLKLLNIGSPGMQEGLNRVAHHATLLPAIRGLLTKASANGIAQIIVFSGSRAGQPDAEGIRNCTTALTALAPDAEAAGVTLLLELLNGHDHPDYQCDSGRFAFAVVRAVGSPRVRALYDIYHAHRMGEDVAATILENLECIGHLHIAGSPRRDFPGPQQAIDYRALVQRVTDAGYTGHWGQEFLGGAEIVAEYERACELFATYA